MSEYKTTFNYHLTHRVLPNIYYINLDIIYEYIITSPETLQKFMQEAMQKAVEMANPDIEPPYPIDEFWLAMQGETADTAVIVIAFPKCERDCDCVQIAFPLVFEKAKYYTCELSSNPLDGEKYFIIGAWEQTQDGLKHINYGRQEITDSKSFGNILIKMIYGKEAVPDEEETGTDGQEKPKIVTINGKTFEIPEMELYCEKCQTTNYIYDDMKPPYKCDNCGSELKP